jgi:hypothetical protein
MQRFVIGVLGCAILACGCAGGPMTSYRVGQDAGSLASLAADGRLLATLASNGDAPSSYVAAHASELGADCGDLASILRSTRPQPETRPSLVKLIQLSERATRLLETLERHPQDEPTAASLAHQLSAVADRASEIEESA